VQARIVVIKLKENQAKADEQAQQTCRREDDGAPSDEPEKFNAEPMS
jgi:hypothetical protein